MVYPNFEYEKFDDTLQNFYQKHFPKKREKFNRYKHKITNWITSEKIKSIEFRYNLYKKNGKMSLHDSPDYLILGHIFKLYNRYLNQCVRTAKEVFYMRELTKYKNDIRKTWDTLNISLIKRNQNRNYHLISSIRTDVFRRRKISRIISMNTSFKSDQNLQVKLTLLTNYRLFPTCKIRPRLYFSLIILPRSMLNKIISNLKPKSSTGYDNISSKLH